MMFDRWLKFAGMYPLYQVRLGRLGKLRFHQVGHGQQEDLAKSRIGVFEEAYLHYAFSHGLSSWLKRHVNYASAEANELLIGGKVGSARFRNLLSRDRVSRRRAAKWLASSMPLASRPLMRFVYVYLVRRGFLDGWAGFQYSFMLATYEAMIAILAYEKLDEENSLGEPRH
jgi:hypothetical protein